MSSRVSAGHSAIQRNGRCSSPTRRQEQTCSGLWDTEVAANLPRKQVINL
jgi:hypothetical protein